MSERKRNVRSINARRVGTLCSEDVYKNACIFSYALISTGFLDKQAQPEQAQKQVPETEGEEIKDDDDAPPKELDAEAWIKWFQDRDCQIPPFIERKLASIWIQIKDERKGTIGEYLKNKAREILRTVPDNN